MKALAWALCAWLATAAPAAEDTAWQDAESLVAAGQLASARERATALRLAARAAGDDAAWTLALVRESDLLRALRRYEEAVRLFQTESWPQSTRERLVLDLFYARALTDYRRHQGWQIYEREAVASTEPVALELWTFEQIDGEIQRLFADAWNARAAFGSEPLAALAEFLEPGEDPERSRGTLRDALTYLWVDALGDASGPRPAPSLVRARLDFAGLLAEDPPESATVDLLSPEIRPLLKQRALLGDLERWHRAQGNVEAAFEARLEWLNRLARVFTRREQLAAIDAAAERVLTELGREHPAWSAGMAWRAEQLMATDPSRWMASEVGGDDTLARAYALARAGRDAHPDSLGGRRCASIVAQLEAPSWSLVAMATDGIGRPSLELTHKHLETLHLRAYRLDPFEAFEVSPFRFPPQRARFWSRKSGRRLIEPLTRDREPVAAWSVPLSRPPDFRAHRTSLIPPLDAPGFYLILASARPDFAETSNQQMALRLVLSDLVLVGRGLGDGLEITARSGATGKLLAGVEVNLYDYRRRELVSTAHTDAEGVAHLPTPELDGFVVARQGEQVALITEWSSPPTKPDPREIDLIYTDRSIYRPGQTVFWKVVAAQGRGTDWQTRPGAEITLELRDPNGETVATTTGTTNDFGSLSGAFTLPQGRLLGTWKLSTGGSSGNTWIDVEEYRRPTFEVVLHDPPAPPRLDRPLTFAGEARTYFGQPLSWGRAVWRVTDQWDDETVASGVVELDAGGRFELGFTPTGSERYGALERACDDFSVHLDVTAPSGETRSLRRWLKICGLAVEARLESPETFFRAGEPVRLGLVRSDTTGLARAGSGVWELRSLEPPGSVLLPGDLRGSRAQPQYDPHGEIARWPEGAVLRRGELEHGADGRARLELGALAAGAYRLRYSTHDGWGGVFELKHEILVAPAAGTASGLPLPAFLLAETFEVRAGGVARFLVGSELPDQELTFELFHGGKRLEKHRLAPGSGIQVVEIPVSAELEGGFSALLTGLRDYRWLQLQADVDVPFDQRRLEVGLASFRNRLRPGESETWKLEVRGGDPRQLELVAAMSDRSLELFAHHEFPDPLGLLPRQTGVPTPWPSVGRMVPFWSRRSGFGDFPGRTPPRGAGLRSWSEEIRRREAERHRPPPLTNPPPDLRVEQGRVLLDEAIVVTEEGEPVEETVSVTGATITDDRPSAAAPSLALGPAVLRRDFSETALWRPHLLLEEDGTTSLEFTVPDAVTSWKLLVQALGRDLRTGTLEQGARSARELLVRPLPPRFLREGDRARLEVAIDNTGERALRGKLDFDLIDPETEQSLLADFGLSHRKTRGVRFAVAAGESTTVGFEIVTPRRLGLVAVRASARAGRLEDGEQRPFVVLPSRLHLSQSRSVALRDVDSRTLVFEDLQHDDPTRQSEQLVVTLDAQLFYSLLSALPYLVDRPVENVELTLNRFLSTGILASLFERYPAMAAMAAEFSQRESQIERWDAADPNRTTLLEETPWLREARGHEPRGYRVHKILDPQIAEANRRSALAKLEAMQGEDGGFAWFPGGQPSPYMTLYLAYGFAKAAEFGVEIPREMVGKTWRYLHDEYFDDWVRGHLDRKTCRPLIIFLGYVLSSYPDNSWTGGVFSAEDRARMLAFALEDWQTLPTMLQAQLALTLHRAGRTDDARRVWDGLIDRATTDPDLGTFWAPEPSSWLWYQDTVEGHAVALRALLAIAPDDPRRRGLVQWLMLDKKLNHWKSTRATAEVIYAVAGYLAKEGTLGAREAATVTLGPRREDFVFEPASYTGKDRQIVLEGKDIGAQTATIEIAKETPGLLFASATWQFATDELPAAARGDFLTIERTFYRRRHDGREWLLEPLAEGARVAVGDEIEVRLALRAQHAAEYVQLRDPRGAGFEPMDLLSGWERPGGLWVYREIRDSGANFFVENLPAGFHAFSYRLRASHAGSFRVGPAQVQALYAPEITAYSAGARVEVGEP